VAATICQCGQHLSTIEALPGCEPARVVPSSGHVYIRKALLSSYCEAILVDAAG